MNYTSWELIFSQPSSNNQLTRVLGGWGWAGVILEPGALTWTRAGSRRERWAGAGKGGRFLGNFTIFPGWVSRDGFQPPFF